jgi:hypothetical protein
VPQFALSVEPRCSDYNSSSVTVQYLKDCSSPTFRRRILLPRSGSQALEDEVDVLLLAAVLPLILQKMALRPQLCHPLQSR